MPSTVRPPTLPATMPMRLGGRVRNPRQTYGVVDPSTGGHLTDAPEWQAADIDEAVAQAVDAQRQWRALAPRDRAGHLRRLADEIAGHREELAILDALDGGFPIRGMRGDVDNAVQGVHVMADMALSLGGQTIPSTAGNLHYTVQQPYGVVARIVPYNHPLFFAVTKIVAPLMAGNAVLLKAPAQTPLSALRLAEIIDDVLPPGLCTIVTGGSPDSARALVRHPAVRRIGFIGSEATGRSIQHDAADTGVKQVTLELGGKNALIAFPDVDPVAAAEAAVFGMNLDWTMGQSCGSTSRLLVHRSIAAEVTNRVADGFAALRAGNPLDETTQVGPLVSDAHQQRVLGAIARARSDGADVIVGGGRPRDVEPGGFFVEPTVLGAVDPSSWIAQTEVFGPVLAISTFDSDDQAIRIANGVGYGLTAAIWTSDVTRAHRAAAELEAGYLWINGSSKHFPGLPFGGTKMSGIGREEGLDEILSYTETKTVSVMLEGPK